MNRSVYFSANLSIVLVVIFVVSTFGGFFGNSASMYSSNFFSKTLYILKVILYLNSVSLIVVFIIGLHDLFENFFAGRYIEIPEKILMYGRVTAFFLLYAQITLIIFITYRLIVYFGGAL